MRHFLLVLTLFLAARAADAATTQRIKIGGSGPIDRPTAHTGFWCFNEWSCHQFDTFTADGTTATVDFVARNWSSVTPSQAMLVRIDNVYVVETNAFNAAMTPIGSIYEPFLGMFQCPNGPADLMLDYNALNSADVAYSTQFDGGFGPEWNANLFQVLYRSESAMDDPFNPGGSTTTGSMQIGAGTGFEFQLARLELTGLTPGTNYTLSYWWYAHDESNGENCGFDDDDLEVTILGETEICLPDNPVLDWITFRTLSFEPEKLLWRFQLELQNSGAGPADNLEVELTDWSTHFQPTLTLANHGDFPPTGGVSDYIGPFETTIGPHLGKWLQFQFRFEDDCSEDQAVFETKSVMNQILDYPTPAPNSRSAPQLAQNEPNPFNPRTTISFELGAAGRVRLDIFDVRGRLARQLADRRYPEGRHDLTWDGRDESGAPAGAGVYYYRLHTTEGERVRKMILLK